MIRSLWIARTGIDAQQVSLEVIANNLANVSTNGFKRGRAVFEDLLYQTMRQPGAQSSQQTQVPSGLQLGTGTRPISTARLHTQGSLQQTGSGLDLAINGPGFFQITLPDGTIAYTRDGSFQKDNQGQIVTSSGYPVQPSITIPGRRPLTITIANDGVVSVTQPGLRRRRKSEPFRWRPSSTGRPAEHRREPLSGNRVERCANAEYAGPQRRGCRQPVLCRNVQRQRGRGTGHHDPDAACL